MTGTVIYSYNLTIPVSSGAGWFYKTRRNDVTNEDKQNLLTEFEAICKLRMLEGEPQDIKKGIWIQYAAHEREDNKWAISKTVYKTMMKEGINEIKSGKKSPVLYSTKEQAYKFIAGLNRKYGTPIYQVHEYGDKWAIEEIRKSYL